MLGVFRSNQKHRLVIIMFFLWKGYLIIIPIRRLLYGMEKNVKLMRYRKWSDFILKSLVRLKLFIHQVVRLHCRYRFQMYTLEYKTIRYPGHAEKFQLLVDLNLTRTDYEVEVDGRQVNPREVFLKVLDPIVDLGDKEDVVLLRVVVSGEKDG